MNRRFKGTITEQIGYIAHTYTIEADSPKEALEKLEDFCQNYDESLEVGDSAKGVYYEDTDISYQGRDAAIDDEIPMDYDTQPLRPGEAENWEQELKTRWPNPMEEAELSTFDTEGEN